MAFIKSSQAFASHLTKEISVRINQENIYSIGLDLKMKFVSKLFFQRLASSKAFAIPKGFGCVLFDSDEKLNCSKGCYKN